MSDLLLAAIGVGVGLLFLVAGGELLVRGASALVMTGFVLPLTVVTLVVCAVRTSHAGPTSSD